MPRPASCWEFRSPSSFCWHSFGDDPTSPVSGRDADVPARLRRERRSPGSFPRGFFFLGACASNRPRPSISPFSIAACSTSPQKREMTANLRLVIYPSRRRDRRLASSLRQPSQQGLPTRPPYRASAHGAEASRPRASCTLRRIGDMFEGPAWGVETRGNYAEFPFLHRGTVRANARCRPQIHSSRHMAGAAEQYRQYAAECLRIAQSTTDDNQRLRLLEMADAWLRLAEAASKREGG